LYSHNKYVIEMSSERTQQRLNLETSKKSANNDTYLKINLENTNRLIPTNDIYKIVDVSERFNTERQRSKFYRLIGTINPTISNPLFNLNDSVMNNKYTWAGFNSYYFLDQSYPKDNNNVDDTDYTFSTAIDSELKEQNGWFGYTNQDTTKSNSLCNFIDMEPKRERFKFIPDFTPYNNTNNIKSVKNWELTITYPFSTDKTHSVVNGGLLIVEIQKVIVSTREMVGIGMYCKHNLKTGDTVRITGTNGFNGEHVIVRVGLDNGDLKENFFVLNLSPNGSIGVNSRIKKVINGVESEYYFRKFKKIKTRNTLELEPDDYETYNLAFSQNIFNDEIVQFVFNEDIDVSDIVDNLGRPLSEIYLSIIKTNSNGLFSRTSSGIESPFLKSYNNNPPSHIKDIPVINKIHNGGTLPFNTFKPLNTSVRVSDAEFYGDLVEYNQIILLETVLSDVHHRFNTLNRESSASLNYVDNQSLAPNLKNIYLGPRHEGYEYKAHYKIKIRDLSNYIEEGDNFTVGTPDYAVNLGDGRIIWRDLIDIGFNESEFKVLDYPFLNGCHYLYDNFCFKLKRQDPFAIWGLYYGNFPEDPVGDRLTDKFTTNNEEDVC